MDRILADQAGVISRRQLLEIGHDDHDIRRLVRRRDLSSVHPGVFIDHTGRPTWLQRAWAGVQLAWPAALAGTSAMEVTERRHGLTDAGDDIVVVIDHHCRVRSRPGLVVERRRDLDRQVLWNLSPPRLRYETAVIDVATACATDFDTISVLAAACGTRRTTAGRRITTLAATTRVARRTWLAAVLRDVDDGACSVLEQRYLRDVERAHGLPRALRQVRAVTPSGIVYRDADLAGLLLSNSMVGCSMTLRRPAIETWSATSMRPSQAGRRCGSDGARASVVPAAPRPSSARC